LLLDLGGRCFDLSRRALVMGILNRTTDSFYDGGAYFRLGDLLRRAERLVAEGATDRARIDDRQRLVDVERAPRRLRSVPVEDAVGDVGRLLHLVEEQPRPERVDRPGGDEERIARPHRQPLRQVEDRALPDGRRQRVRRGAGAQAADQLRARRGLQDVPGLGLAELARPLQPRGLLVARVDLQREPVGRIEQLDQQREARAQLGQGACRRGGPRPRR
jgi:hypothetical protein